MSNFYPVTGGDGLHLVPWDQAPDKEYHIVVWYWDGWLGYKSFPNKHSALDFFAEWWEDGATCRYVRLWPWVNSGEQG